MAKDYDNYVYYFSKKLDMEYCHAKDGSHIYTSDGVRYNMKEIETLKDLGGIDKNMHLLKKIFPGEIVLKPVVAVPIVQSKDIF